MYTLQLKRAFLACVAACDPEDRFHQEMFIQLSLGCTPAAVALDKNGIVFLPRVGQPREGDAEALPEDLQQRLQQYNAAYADTPLVFAMLPNRIDAGGNRRVSEAVLQKQSWCWQMHKKEVAAHVLAIPVLLEWHSGYRRGQQAWFDFLQLTPPVKFALRTRNSRIMHLLQMVEVAGKESGLTAANIQHQCETIFAALQVAFILISMKNGEVVGWVFSLDRRGVAHILIPPGTESEFLDRGR